MKKVLRAILLISLSPLLIGMFAVAMVVALCFLIYDGLWLIRFCWTHAGRVYLICSRRRGWEAALRHNVIPSLPENVTAVWLESPEKLAYFARVVCRAHLRRSIPFLALVTPFGIHTLPLNQRLLPFKGQGKVSLDTRKHARTEIEAALADWLCRYIST